MTKHIYVLVSCMLCSLVCAQERVISGYVHDSKNGERLIGAYVFAASTNTGSQLMSTTNTSGFFSLKLPGQDTVFLSVSFVGYQKQRISVSRTDVQIDVFLVQDTLLGQVEIQAGRQLLQDPQMSSLQIPMGDIRQIPALLGETDVLRAFQLMPGVQGGKEGTSGLHVRGGSPDQNLILLDDVPLYYVNHIGGFISVFDVDALQDVKLIKGGFPARYGGRLSSVLDIRMKEGNRKKLSGNWQLGPITSKISLEAPIYKDKTTIMVSLRRCNLDLFSRLLTRIQSDGEFSSGYTFYDGYAKITHKLSSKDKISLSFYQGHDRIFIRQKEHVSAYRQQKIRGESNVEWGNRMLGLHWNRAYTSRLFGTITLAYTQFGYQTKLESVSKQMSTGALIQDNRIEFQSGVRDISLKSDYEYWLDDKIQIRFGTNAVLHRFRPGINQYRSKSPGQNRDTTLGSADIYAKEGSAYLEATGKLSNKLTATVGLHSAVYHVQNRTFSSLQPRFSTSYMLSKRSALKASFSRMSQFIHLLSSSGAGLPTDLWVPATARINPENAWQTALGYAHTLRKWPLELSIEAYYKKMDNLIEFKEGATFFGSGQDWQDKIVTNGIGKAYGVELLLQKKQGTTTGWIGYTYSHNIRQFEELNNNNPFPYRYDRRHSGSLVIIHHFNKKISLSGTFVYETGTAITLAQQRYDAISAENPFGRGIEFRGQYDAHIYGGRNGYRMPAYHRMDVSMDFHSPKKRGEGVWNISFYNIYNRQNPYYLYFKQDDQGENKLYMLSLFAIIPSISYRRSF